MPSISASDSFVFGAKPGTERILKNCTNLLSIIKGEVMGDRQLGLDPSWIDQPIEVVRSSAVPFIKDLIQSREPRAIVKDVQFVLSPAGDLNIKVVLDFA